MTAAEAARAPLEFSAPARRFEQYQDAARAAADYETSLAAGAARRRANGLAVTDQDQREEALCLFPRRASLPPLAIVGGMGPLAGAVAFRRACLRFRDSRPVALYQACSVPDRSTVILNNSGPDAPLCRAMALRLAVAVRHAVSLAGQAGQPVRCILACNSAHYFWALLRDELRAHPPDSPGAVDMISLVQCSVDAIQTRSCGNALLLATEGASVGRVFSAPFRLAGLPFDEPAPPLRRLLMRSIFEGVKALDEDRAVALGDEFFAAVLRAGRSYDCVVAGCTEIPLIVDLLRLRGRPAVRAFLSKVRIVDPLEEAICRS